METRPGWQTTEFWITVFIQLVGVLVLFGVVTPDEQSEVNEILTKLGAIIVQAAAAFGYSLSRGTAKKGIAADLPADKAIKK